jgi:hypothetical protein
MRSRDKLSNTRLTVGPKFIYANSSTEKTEHKQFAISEKILFSQRLQVKTVLLTSPEFLLYTVSGSGLVIRIWIQGGKNYPQKKKSEEISRFQVLDVIFGGLEASRVT